MKKVLKGLALSITLGVTFGVTSGITYYYQVEQSNPSISLTTTPIIQKEVEEEPVQESTNEDMLQFKYQVLENEEQTKEMEMLKFMQGYNKEVEFITKSDMTLEEKKQQISILYNTYITKCRELGIEEEV